METKLNDYEIQEKSSYEVGEYIGWFKVLEVFKDKNCNKTYKVQCMKCGKILNAKSKKDLFRYIRQNNCNHRNKEDNILKPGTIVKGKFKVLRVCGQNKNGLHYYDFQCIDCGFIKYHTLLGKLKFKTCNHYGTGMQYKWSDVGIKRAYYHITARCYNKNCKAYPNYGGRGIIMCKEWYDKDNPYECRKAFDTWAQTHGYEKGLEINRKDVNGNYCPENCEWVTKSYNSSHDKRNLILLTVDGYTNSITKWSNIIFGNTHRLFGWIYRNGHYEDTNKIIQFIHNKLVSLNLSNAVLWVDQTYMSYESWDINCMYPPGTIYKYMLEHGEIEASIFVYNRLESLGLKNVVGFTE